jgi:arylsulfatase A-like enzyme
VPFAMRWPAKIKGGKVYDNPIISLDIFATAINYAGAESKNALDGVDIVPYILGVKSGVPHDQLFWRQYDKKAYAVRSGNQKLVKMNNESEELYDLDTDISESNSIDNPAQHQKLLEASEQWKSQLMDPIFLGLMQNEEYNELHADRFELEKY